VRRWFTVTALVAALLGCTPLARARVVPSLTTIITMDCTSVSTVCTFDPGSQGSPEHGLVDFTPVDPGWSATFNSDQAITWGYFFDAYQAEFGMGGSFTIDAPGGMQFSGVLTSGVAFSFLSGFASTAAWFQGYWNNGLYADGFMTGDAIGSYGLSATLAVTTYNTPEPSSIFLLGSALVGLSGTVRRKLR
jgi:hypothetical protein